MGRRCLLRRLWAAYRLVSWLSDSRRAASSSRAGSLGQWLRRPPGTFWEATLGIGAATPLRRMRLAGRGVVPLAADGMGVGGFATSTGEGPETRGGLSEKDRSGVRG